MRQGDRPGLSSEQVAELWRRRRAGETITAISRAFGRPPDVVRDLVAASSGFPPRLRPRSARVLSLVEREEISRGLAESRSIRSIARDLRRAPSTISREVGRHGGPARYRAIRADARAWQRARRPKPCKLARSPLLRALIAAKLVEDWSPEQISGWLARTPPSGQHALHVSSETIYRSLCPGAGRPA